MSDLQKYIAKRKTKEQKFAENYEFHCQEIKVGVMLKMAREEAVINDNYFSRSTTIKIPGSI